MASSSRRLAPRKRPKQLRSRETRNRILEAAARVFARHGYAAGTTNRIADEAGLSVGSLYQYFPNKDAILLELVKAHVADGVVAIQHRLEDAEGLPEQLEDRLRVFVRAAIDTHRDDPELHRVLFEESPRPRELLDQLRDLEEWVVSAVSDLLDDDPRVEAENLHLTAWIVVTTIESLTHRYISHHGDDLDLEAFENEVVDLLDGYLRSGAGVGDRRTQA